MTSASRVFLRFRVGQFECFAICDSTHITRRRLFAGSISTGLADEIVRTADSSTLAYPAPRTCLLVRGPQETCVLIDAGAGIGSGTSAWDQGELQRHLALTGTDPDNVGVVILTHAHLGHAGGALDISGRPAYRRARYALGREEWAFWMSRPDLRSRRLQGMADRIHAHLSALEGRVTLLDSGAEIVPGIRAVAAPGHSAGHLAISISSENEELLCLSDTVLAPVHLEHPEWYTRYDLRPEQSVTSRVRLLDRAAASGALVHAYHFPFPGLGRVRSKGRAWQWQPYDAQAT